MSNSGVLLERARLLLEQGRVNDAIKEIKNVLQQDPDNDMALAIYARCLFEKNQFDEGITVVNNAIHIDPTNGFYFYLLGFAYYRKDRLTEAVTHLSKAISLDPYQSEYYGLLAFTHIENKKFELALGKADEGLEIDPENITCLNARSIALNKLKRTDDAIETMQDALQKDPDNEFTHATIGWNLLEKGKHREATKHFREALRINPDHGTAKMGLKEALKSKIPPYRWLLQFGFWMNNKGRNFRWIFAIGLFIIVRLVITATQGNKDVESVGLIVAGAYFVFVATSWIIGPLANAFLLFHKDGKYALDHSEKWNAVAFLICVVSGIAIMVLSAGVADKAMSQQYMYAGLVALSVCIPAGHMRFPIRLRGNSLSQWMSIGLLSVAIVTVAMALIGLPAVEVLLMIYFIMFIVYTWTSQ